MLRTFGARNCRLVLLQLVRKVDWLSCRALRALMDLPQGKGGFPSCFVLFLSTHPPEFSVSVFLYKCASTRIAAVVTA